MYNIMTKLINKRFYKTREEAQQKCDVFSPWGASRTSSTRSCVR